MNFGVRNLRTLTGSIRGFKHTTNLTKATAAAADSPEAPLKDMSEIPGPKQYPIVGCMPYFVSNKSEDIVA